MPINQALHDELRAHLAGLDAVEERSMFGSAGFMWRGNLLCAVKGDELLVRVAKEDTASLIGEDDARAMVMGDRTSRGWLWVPMPVADRAMLLTKWLTRARAYAQTLPAK